MMKTAALAQTLPGRSARMDRWGTGWTTGREGSGRAGITEGRCLIKQSKPQLRRLDL